MLVFACLLTALASAVQVSNQSVIKPQAGALNVYLNSTSINNMMQMMVPIMSYYSLANQDYILKFKDSNFLYDIDLDHLHFNDVQFKGIKSFELNPENNELHIRLLDIDVSAVVYGNISLLQLPIKQQAIIIKGIDVDVTLEVTTLKDRVHWLLKDFTNIRYNKIEIKMENEVLDKFIDLIVRTIQFFLNLSPITTEFANILDDNISAFLSELIDK